MFTTLRSRLLLSYGLLIGLTLLVTAVTLFFVLRTRPLLNETVSLRLFNLLTRAVALQQERNLNFTPRRLTRNQQQALNVLGRQIGVRIILTDKSNVVIYDTTHFYAPGDTIELNGKPYQPPVDVSTQMQQGILENANGEQFIFMAHPPLGDEPQIIVAQPAPRSLNIGQTIQFYGEDIFVPLIQSGIIGLIVALILSLIITRSVARPLQDVARSTSAVTKGHLDQKAPVYGPEEVRVVANAFNQMTEHVLETQAAQRDFLANVTHDLRTPLTSIQGFSQAIIEGVASNPAAAQRAAQIIYDEAGRLNRMVQELLDLARIEAGRFTMRQHSIRMDELLNALAERLAPRVNEKQLGFNINIPTLPPIAGDGDRLVQVYTNLIDNAIRHTPPHGAITLQAMTSNNGVLVQVCDTGEGIPAADLSHIFDRFYQVDKSRQSEHREGAGLGLTITKGIVEAHGGKIWVESREGQGTTFSTWFPVAAHDATTAIRKRSGLFKKAV